MAHAFGTAAIRDSVLDLIGKTPLMQLNRLPQPGCAEVVVKLEAYNPAGSVKDRIALAMIEAAERSGELQPGATIVEPTSGNTGIGLAWIFVFPAVGTLLALPEAQFGVWSGTPFTRRRRCWLPVSATASEPA